MKKRLGMAKFNISQMVEFQESIEEEFIEEEIELEDFEEGGGLMVMDRGPSAIHTTLKMEYYLKHFGSFCFQHRFPASIYNSSPE